MGINPSPRTFVAIFIKAPGQEVWAFRGFYKCGADTHKELAALQMQNYKTASSVVMLSG